MRQAAVVIALVVGDLPAYPQRQVEWLRSMLQLHFGNDEASIPTIKDVDLPNNPVKGREMANLAQDYTFPQVEQRAGLSHWDRILVFLAPQTRTARFDRQ